MDDYYRAYQHPHSEKYRRLVAVLHQLDQLACHNLDSPMPLNLGLLGGSLVRQLKLVLLELGGCATTCHSPRTLVQSAAYGLIRLRVAVDHPQGSWVD